MLALSNLVPEILGSIQGEIQPKQEGDSEEGWSGVCLLSYQTSVWILAGENLSIQSNISCVYNNPNKGTADSPWSFKDRAISV